MTTPRTPKLRAPANHKARRGTKFHKAVLELARANAMVSDELEIDDDAKLSCGPDNGCFVQAWLWVSFSDDPQLDLEDNV